MRMCAQVLLHLQPKHLALFSTCCKAARRLAASDTVWRPLYDAMQAATGRRQETAVADMAGSATRASAAAAPVPIGFFKEKYRRLRVERLRKQVWSSRLRAAACEEAHTEARQRCEEIERAVQRLRATVVSEHAAKRQRLADTSWHPAAVQRQLRGCDITTTRASAGWSDVDVGSGCSSTAEHRLRKFEIQSEAQRTS